MNQLKQRLLKQAPSEQDSVTNLCLIMEAVGGYEQLMNLPLPALEPILRYIKFRQEQEDKRFASLFGKPKK